LGRKKSVDRYMYSAYNYMYYTYGDLKMIGLSKNSVKLLKLFYGHPHESFYIQQIGRLIGKKPGVFQRMLYKLEKEGILISEFKANARFFHVNKSCPIYSELKSIVAKTGI